MKRILIAFSVLLFAAVAVPAAAEQGKKGKHKGQGLEVIPLPQGFGPEGITTTKRHTFLVGSRESGAIYKGSLRTGDGDILVDAPAGRSATGIKVDRRNRLFVSGARTGQAYVYDARTGAELASYELFATQTPGDTFINDVVVTRRAAYFTDSVNQQLYVLDFGRRGALPAAARTLPLTGELEYDDIDGTFELNGIAATRNGKRLIAVQSRTGQLFSIDPASGDTKQIDLQGVDALPNGDGLLLRGKKLYVVQNQLDKVAVLRVSRGLSTATWRREITDSDFTVPTTIAAWGHRLYVVNAKFNRPNPDNSYEVVRVPKR
jgi:sugar lactone lactonase YvrE